MRVAHGACANLPGPGVFVPLEVAAFLAPRLALAAGADKRDGYVWPASALRAVGAFEDARAQLLSSREASLELLTPAQVAALTGCSPQTVTKAVRSGQLAAERRGRQWWIVATAADHWRPPRVSTTKP